MIQIIDAAAFQQMIIHAAAALTLHTQELNDLNVFPVPDGDTGTNMSLTMNAAAIQLKQGALPTVGEVSQKTASALLRGARGNSGVILSLLFRGLAKGLKDRETADGRDFAIALDYGVAAAYKAVMKPAEGTILTVSRMAAAYAAGVAREENNIESVLIAAIKEGNVALEETINQNPVLKKAGVVDAGGKGFLIILQGMLDSIQGVPMPEVIEEVPQQQKAEFASFSTEDITFGYCTEFICARENDRDPDILRQTLNKMGDSLVLVEDDDIIKVHVHTDNPGSALQEALQYGALLKIKIENMREQHTQLTKGGTSDVPAEQIVPQKVSPTKQYGFVAVCAGQGLETVFKDLGVDGTISGGQTMNPSTQDILLEIDRTPAEIIYVLPNNKNIIMAAQQCVPLVTDKQVIVLPSKSICQGISAMLTMDLNSEEAVNTEAMTQALNTVKTSEITYAARDSDFDGFAISQGDYLALLEHQLFGTDKDLTAILTKLSQDETHQQAEFISIFYGEDVTEEQAAETEALFSEACPNADISLLPGGQPVYYYIISAE